mmetsp:Transcript_17229/g.31005  ORF Transcript_17229/g.31005 Transcript_17229/m.31005 type:complete len:244 (-) Transcript_17229:10374-11105(-)
MIKNLLVLGGNGFIGSAICKFALSQGIKVSSVSRSGVPKHPAEWQSKVNYIAANALETTAYAEALNQSDAIIHTIGVLIDSKTPLNIRSDYEGSYEQMNRDSAIKVLETLENTNKHFVYISAERGMFFSPRYLSTKREVEDYMQTRADRLSYSILRPGFIYDDKDTIKKVLATSIDLSKFFEDQILNRVGLGSVTEKVLPAKSMHVDTLAKAAVLCAFRPELKFSSLNVSEIEDVAHRYNTIS